MRREDREITDNSIISVSYHVNSVQATFRNTER